MVIAFILTEIVFHSMHDVANAVRRNSIIHILHHKKYIVWHCVYIYSDWSDDCWLDISVNVLSTIIMRSSAYICEHSM